jgi:hypothetical protein
MAGELTAEALAAPNAMAGLLAEQALRRQEARWAEMLGPDPGAVPDGGALRWVDESQHRPLSTAGLGRPRADGARPLRDQAVIRFTAPMHARNLHVCGRVTPVLAGAGTAEGAAVRLRIELNGLQRTQPELPRSGPLNVGIASPLVLPGQRNTLVLRRDPAGGGPVRRGAADTRGDRRSGAGVGRAVAGAGVHDGARSLLRGIWPPPSE